MTQTLKGKHAIVTGSTSGIGEGIAKRLAEAGCDVTLNGFGDAKLIEAQMQSLTESYGVKVDYSDADLTKASAIEKMIDHANKQFGRVDIIVNNAGVQHVSPVEEFPTEKWDLVIALNLTAAFHTTRLAVAAMRERGYGRILNIASAHGLVASANKSAYVASKHGIIGLSKSVALELAGTGVTCNAICPGWVLTPLVQKQIEAKAAANGCSVKDAELDLLSEKQPSKQFVTPEQLGGLAVFLCSEDAAQVTGASYLMDGGWVAQ